MLIGDFRFATALKMFFHDTGFRFPGEVIEAVAAWIVHKVGVLSFAAHQQLASS